jgi:hypothetical protein
MEAPSFLKLLQNPIKPLIWGATYHIKHDSSKVMVRRFWCVTYLWYRYFSCHRGQEHNSFEPPSWFILSDTVAGPWLFYMQYDFAQKSTFLCHLCRTKHSQWTSATVMHVGAACDATSPCCQGPLNLHWDVLNNERQKIIESIGRSMLNRNTMTYYWLKNKFESIRADVKIDLATVWSVSVWQWHVYISQASIFDTPALLRNVPARVSYLCDYVTSVGKRRASGLPE